MKTGGMRKLFLTATLAISLTIACGAEAVEGPLRMIDESDPAPSIPDTTASAITFRPINEDGLNSQTHLYGTGADPAVITLGPRQGGQPGWAPYPGKTSMEFELPHGTPVLAPLDMVLVGFNNRNAEFRNGDDGERFEPFDDLELCFESSEEDWPGMVVCTYHLVTSPLLLGQDVNPDCGRVTEWPGDGKRAQGHQWFEYADYDVSESSASRACDALIGASVKRGQVIGFAGSVGDHSMAPFRFKVPDPAVNTLVTRGNRNLHWVQPGAFFYWRCFAPDNDFTGGILAYPFECEGYDLPPEHRSLDFKYSDVR